MVAVARPGCDEVVRLLLAAHDPADVAAAVASALLHVLDGGRWYTHDGLRTLIRHGSTIDPRQAFPQYKGRTLLHFAAAAGDVPSVIELLGLGADVNAQNEDGRTPLMMACHAQARSEHGPAAEVVELMMMQPQPWAVAAGARPVDLPLQDKHGDTVLEYAVLAQNDTVLQMLLDHCAGAQQAAGATEPTVIEGPAVDGAGAGASGPVPAGHGPELAGPGLAGPPPGLDVHKRYRDGYTILHRWVKDRYYKSEASTHILRLLVDAEVGLYAVDEAGHTALELAQAEGDLKAAWALEDF